MNKLRSLLLGGFIVLFFVNTVQAKERIDVQGSTTALPIMQIITEEFMDENPDIEVTISGGGSGVGIAALLDQIVPIAMSSREMKENEKQKGVVKGLNIQQYAIALDAIAIIVYPENHFIDRIQSETLKRIYTGFITNWRELGGDDKPLVAISRDTNSGTFEIFNEHILKGEEMAPEVLRLVSNRPILDEVSRNSNAIGYVGFGYLTRNIKALILDGIEPTYENVRNGLYPLSRNLYLYTSQQPEGAVKRFIDFILSDKGQNIIEEEGFIRVK